MQCVTTPKIRLRFFMGEVRYTRIYGKKGTKLSKSKSEKLKGPWFPHKWCFLFSYFSFLNSLVPWFPQSLQKYFWWFDLCGNQGSISLFSTVLLVPWFPQSTFHPKCYCWNVVQCGNQGTFNIIFFRVWSLDFHIPSDNGSLTYLSSMWKSRNHQFTKM